uniref:Uncharacterized protein n=1 Tax=Sphaerodactylus townsendi TaxID=933632 RepID=A0ACB8FRS8_9SAUR
MNKMMGLVQRIQSIFLQVHHPGDVGISEKGGGITYLGTKMVGVLLPLEFMLASWLGHARSPEAALTILHLGLPILGDLGGGVWADIMPLHLPFKAAISSTGTDLCHLGIS